MIVVLTCRLDYQISVPLWPMAPTSLHISKLQCAVLLCIGAPPILIFDCINFISLGDQYSQVIDLLSNPLGHIIDIKFSPYDYHCRCYLPASRRPFATGAGDVACLTKPVRAMSETARVVIQLLFNSLTLHGCFVKLWQKDTEGIHFGSFRFGTKKATPVPDIPM